MNKEHIKVKYMIDYIFKNSDDDTKKVIINQVIKNNQVNELIKDYNDYIKSQTNEYIIQ